MTTTTERRPYHHGNLRTALIETALEMLEAGETLSLRAVARRAGVSQTAPYRHFADRDALDSALATEGFRELMSELDGADVPSTPEGIAEIAVGYVRFALRRPELFTLMFGRECDDQNDERVQAAGALHEYLDGIVARAFPGSDPQALSTAGWALAHGLAFLHLDGKLPNADRTEVDERVRAAFAAMLPAPSSGTTDH